MGLFNKTKVLCSVCEKETGTDTNKKHKIQNGYICNECFLKAGYAPGFFCFADTADAIKNKVDTVNKQEKARANYNFQRVAGGLEVDWENKKWLFNQMSFVPGGFELEIVQATSEIRDFNDIIQYDYIVDEETVLETKKSGIGRAIVGNILFGKTGAVVGAVTGKEITKSKTATKSAEIKITLNEIPPNSEKYSFLIGSPVHTTMKERSLFYGGYGVEAADILDALQKIIYLNEKSKEDSAIKSEIDSSNMLSAADELRKFKALLDDGIITEEDFAAKKKQLLGL